MYCPNPDCPSLLATGEPAEFREGTHVCKECGQALAAGPSPAASAPGAARGSGRSVEALLTTVATYDIPEAAGAAQALLEAEGIAAFVDDDHLAGVAPFLSGMVGGVKLKVASAEADRAVAVLHYGMTAMGPHELGEDILGEDFLDGSGPGEPFADGSEGEEIAVEPVVTKKLPQALPEATRSDYYEPGSPRATTSRELAAGCVVFGVAAICVVFLVRYLMTA